MISLGIESTAHSFGVGIMKDKNCLANVVDMYRPPEGKGLHPNKVKKHHQNKKDKVLRKALEKANLKLKDIDLISYSKGPGMPPSLLVGANFAKKIKKDIERPVMGVNHCIAHIEIGKLMTKAKDPVVLYVSGGNTQVLAHARGKYRVFGETLDLAIGNAIDKVIRKAGLGYPGGPIMEEKAKKGNYIELPYVVKGMDLSFSGITTEAIKKLKNNKLEDVCYSFQETCYSMLTEVTERAMAHTQKQECLLTGGVAASKRLQNMLKTMCKERNGKFFTVPMNYAGDNPAMIAWTGLLDYENGGKPEQDKIDFIQNWRTDDVEINWIQ